MGAHAHKKNSIYQLTAGSIRDERVSTQNMVCDIEPEQRYDITSKQWQQRGERDLGA